MKNQKMGIVLFMLLVCCILCGIKSVADEEGVFFEKKSQTSIDGEPAGPPSILRVWVKGNRLRYENEKEKDKYVLILMDKGKTYELDKTQKTFKKSLNETAKLKEVNERSMVVSKRTGRKKKIEKWNCYEVVLDTIIQGKKMKAICWLSEDIHISSDIIEKIAKFSQMKLMEELVKFSGYPVKMILESTLQGKNVRIVSTLTKIRKEPIKANFLKVPFDYNEANEAAP